MRAGRPGLQRNGAPRRRFALSHSEREAGLDAERSPNRAETGRRGEERAAEKRGWGEGGDGGGWGQPRFMVMRNSALDLVFLRRLLTSSIASTVFMSERTLRSR